VVGGADAPEPRRRAARALAAALARGGAWIVCGGRGGVMEAAARGCAEAGGVAVGILPGDDAREANDWIGLPLATGLGEARNALVVRCAQAVVAVGGGWGTLSEVALAAKTGRPVALLGEPATTGLELPRFDDPERAARWALDAARRAPDAAERSGPAPGSEDA